MVDMGGVWWQGGYIHYDTDAHLLDGGTARSEFEIMGFQSFVRNDQPIFAALCTPLGVCTHVDALRKWDFD